MPYDEKADMWSLGCILYEMITLSPPFKGNNMLLMAKRIAECDYVRLSEAAPNTNPLLIEIVQKLLEPEPNLRPDIIQLGALLAPFMFDRLDALQNDSVVSTRDAAQLRDKCHKLENALKAAGPPSRTSTRNNTTTPSEPSTPVPRSRMPSVIMSPRNLRPVDDPITSMITALHKLIFISQLPPSMSFDPSRTFVDKYKRILFGGPAARKANGLGSLKDELTKITHVCTKYE